MNHRKSVFIGTLAVLWVLLGAMSWVQPSSAADPDPDRYIVSFLNVGKGKAALKAAGARIVLDLPKHEAAAVHIPPRALQGLRKNPNIEYIEPDHIREPYAQTIPWGIDAVQANQDDITVTVDDSLADNQTICIIDSGYSLGHEDLPSGTKVTFDSEGAKTDGCHHGTHVAGTIAALNNTDGVVGVLSSNKINLHIVKVFGDNCIWAYSSSLVAALDRCVENGANVINMSLGGSFKNRTEQRAFNRANNDGVLSVAAAGNGGGGAKSYPASYSSVVSVAAVDSALVVASFSQQNSQVELSGPGVNVLSTVPMGTGLEESVNVDGTDYDATAMEDSHEGSGTGALFECDGVGNPGDCAEANGGVCLIQRGDITFAAKVIECKDGGGVAAVIYNNVAGGINGTLGGVFTTIPSVGITKADGEYLIANKLGTSTTVTVGQSNYAYFNGTSMATPHVVGVAALVWSNNELCTNQEIRDSLTSTAMDLGNAGRDNAYGFGLVQADDANTAAAGLNCTGDGSGGGGGGGGSCELGQVGDSCTDDADCCSSKCKGKRGGKTCK